MHIIEHVENRFARLSPNERKELLKSIGQTNVSPQTLVDDMPSVAMGRLIHAATDAGFSLREYDKEKDAHYGHKPNRFELLMRETMYWIHGLQYPNLYQD